MNSLEKWEYGDETPVEKFNRNMDKLGNGIVIEKTLDKDPSEITVDDILGLVTSYPSVTKVELPENTNPDFLPRSLNPSIPRGEEFKGGYLLVRADSEQTIEITLQAPSNHAGTHVLTVSERKATGWYQTLTSWYDSVFVQVYVDAEIGVDAPDKGSEKQPYKTLEYATRAFRAGSNSGAIPVFCRIYLRVNQTHKVDKRLVLNGSGYCSGGLYYWGNIGAGHPVVEISTDEGEGLFIDNFKYFGISGIKFNRVAPYPATMRLVYLQQIGNANIDSTHMAYSGTTSGSNTIGIYLHRCGFGVLSAVGTNIDTLIYAREVTSSFCSTLTGTNIRTVFGIDACILYANTLSTTIASATHYKLYNGGEYRG